MSGNRKRDAGRPAIASGPGAKDNSAEEESASTIARQDIVRSLADRGTAQGCALPDETTGGPVQRPATQPADSGNFDRAYESNRFAGASKSFAA